MANSSDIVTHVEECRGRIVMSQQASNPKSIDASTPKPIWCALAGKRCKHFLLYGGYSYKTFIYINWNENISYLFIVLFLRCLSSAPPIIIRYYSDITFTPDDAPSESRHRDGNVTVSHVPIERTLVSLHKKVLRRFACTTRPPLSNPSHTIFLCLF